MSVVIVIPARFESKRFPGKPLAMIAGSTMLRRTWSIAKAVSNVDEVYVATDDDRIAGHVTEFGGKPIMTSATCDNGTERAFYAVEKLEAKPDIVINLQGDAVLTPPWVIQALVDTMRGDREIGLATPAIRLNSLQVQEIKKLKRDGHAGGTLVTFDLKGNALYFSRSLIPLVRDGQMADAPIYRHIGIYGYTRQTLAKYLTLAPSPLEQVEKLEQLRALENGISIRVVPVDYKGRTHWAVDSPDDVKVVERIIAEEGELI